MPAFWLIFFLALTFDRNNGTGAVHIKTAEAAYRDASAAASKKQFTEAIPNFRKALEIEPTFTEAFQGLIEACLATGKKPEAAAAITQLLQIEPDLTRYRLMLAQILMQDNEIQRALAQFSFVLQREPLNPDALFGFAESAGRLGMHDRATAALERGRKQYPNDPRFNPPQSRH